MRLRARIVVSCFFAGAPLATAAPAAAEVEPANLRWQILPGAGADGIPIPEQTAPAGPIGATVTNATVPGLLHTGTTSVDYGFATVQSRIDLDAALLPIGGGFCIPAPCGGSTAEWSDRLTITADGIPAGTLGSFTARILTIGTLEAEVPAAWFPAGALATARYGISVLIEDEERDRVSPTCVAVPEQACSVGGQSRLYFPEDYPSTPAQATPLPSLFPEIPLGPYDFRFGEPFELQVLANASTSIARGGNMSGDVLAHTLLFLSWGGVEAVYDQGGALGQAIPLAQVQVAAQSGLDWLLVPEPAAATGPAAAAVALAALAAVVRRARPGRGP